jgi:hypothetical protein
MAFVKRKNKITIDVSGPDGNAFVILGYAKNLANQLNLDYEAISKDMRSSNYDHLLKTFDRHFGHVVDIVGYKE